MVKRMPEVYIDSLTIHNFGPYYGEHTFDFGAEGHRRATLIGGKNGAGPTCSERYIWPLLAKAAPLI